MATFQRQFTPRSTPPLTGKEVVVIDDDEVQYRVLQDLLEPTDAKLLFFNDAEEAWDFLSTNDADLIISDIMMPGMDGWDLHSRVRASSRHNTTGFIFTTCLISNRQEPLMSDEFARTMTLAKPIESTKLFRAINRILESQKKGAPQGPPMKSLN